MAQVKALVRALNRSRLLWVVWVACSNASTLFSQERTSSDVDAAAALSRSQLVLMTARTLVCSFESGYVTTTVNGESKTESDGFGSPIIFKVIDLKAGKAVMSGNGGEGQISVGAGRGSLSFFEITEGGNIIVTSVYPLLRHSVSENEFVAFHSRHISMAPRIAAAVTAQYRGVCRVLK